MYGSAKPEGLALLKCYRASHDSHLSRFASKMGHPIVMVI